jgi:hypothetical protein
LPPSVSSAPPLSFLARARPTWADPVPSISWDGGRPESGGIFAEGTDLPPAAPIQIAPILRSSHSILGNPLNQTLPSYLSGCVFSSPMALQTTPMAQRTGSVLVAVAGSMNYGSKSVNSLCCIRGLLGLGGAVAAWLHRLIAGRPIPWLSDGLQPGQHC